MSFCISSIITFENTRNRARLKRTIACSHILAILIAYLAIVDPVSADYGFGRRNSWGTTVDPESLDAFKDIENMVQQHDLIQSPSIKLGDGS